MAAGYTFAEVAFGGSAADDDLPIFDTASTDGFLEVALRAPYPFVFDATATSAGGFPPSSDRAGIDAEISLVGTTPTLPEAQTYIMLLAGLGLMIFVARRRRRNLVA